MRDISYRSKKMAKPLSEWEKLLVRLVPGTVDRIRGGDPKVDATAFIREAIEEKLKRRERAKPRPAKPD